MRVITTEIPARVSIRYVCNVCGKKYRIKNMALRCEARPLEKVHFKLGDRVKGRSPRACGNTNKPYHFEGVIIRIVGPILSESDCFSGSREDLYLIRNGHVYMYEVEYKCPRCNEVRSDLCYFTEIKLAD